MKLCTFGLASDSAKTMLGLVEGTTVYEIDQSRSVIELLSSGGRGIRKLDRKYDLSKVSLRAPVPRPGKIVAAIVNTVGMLGGDDVRLSRPRLDMKAPSTVVGPGFTIGAPDTGIRPEVELAALVGKTLSKAGPEECREALVGFTVLNDVTAPRDAKEDAYEAYRRDPKGEIRKTVMRGPLFRSKNHDGFCPMGPWLVTPDELGSAPDLRMTTRFEGQTVQEGSTGDYIFSPEALASYVSGFLALEPGDVISCGSVGWTREALQDLDPTEFVLPTREGMLEVEIERIGVLRNPVRPAP